MEVNTYQPPEWLNEKFLQIALKENLRRGSLKLTDYNISPATNKGENYVSQMFRVSATIASRQKDPEDMSIVVKSLPKGAMVEKFAHEMRFFERETQMFSETLPALNKVLEEIGETKLSADAYYCQGPPKNLLIFEDLKQSGFRMADRLEGLDLPHSVLVVESIATLHGASLETMKRNPTIPSFYGTGFWCRQNAYQSSKMIIEGVNALADVATKWVEFSEDIPRRLREMSLSTPEKVYKATDIGDDDFAVLNHGDTWTNNFMFRYEKENPVALKFVDFQLCAYNSPVFDLLYFIFTSPQPQVISNHLSLLLELYHKRLVEVCKKINYPLRYSLNDLKKDFFKRLAFGLCISVTVFPIIMAPGSGATDLDDLISDDGISIDTNHFLNESFLKRMRVMLPIFIENGLLD